MAVRNNLDQRHSGSGGNQFGHTDFGDGVEQAGGIDADTLGRHIGLFRVELGDRVRPELEAHLAIVQRLDALLVVAADWHREGDGLEFDDLGQRVEPVEGGTFGAFAKDLALVGEHQAVQAVTNHGVDLVRRHQHPPAKAQQARQPVDLVNLSAQHFSSGAHFVGRPVEIGRGRQSGRAAENRRRPFWLRIFFCHRGNSFWKSMLRTTALWRCSSSDESGDAPCSDQRQSSGAES